MDTIYLLIIMVLCHWFGDFVLQSDELASKKHKTVNDLLLHSFDYALVFYFVGIILSVIGLFNITFVGVLLFSALTFLLHVLVDHTMSRIGYDSLNKGRQNEFLGYLILDQSIHLILLEFSFILIF